MKNLSAALVALAWTVAPLNAIVVFEGGSGQPLTVTITEPITFTATEDLATGSFIALVFREVYDAFPGIFFAEKTGDIGATGSQGLSFSADQGNFKMGTSGGGINTWGPTDFMFGFTYQAGSQDLQTGDTITINPGSVVSAIAFNPRPPDVTGSVEIELTDNSANTLAFGAGQVIIVPEPSAFALAAALAALGLVVARRR